MKKKKYNRIQDHYCNHEAGNLAPDKRMTREEFRVWYENTRTDKKRSDIMELKINR